MLVHFFLIVELTCEFLIKRQSGTFSKKVDRIIRLKYRLSYYTLDISKLIKVRGSIEQSVVRM